MGYHNLQLLPSVLSELHVYSLSPYINEQCCYSFLCLSSKRSIFRLVNSFYRQDWDVVVAVEMLS